MKGFKIAAILAGVVSVIAVAVIALVMFVFSSANEAEDRANVFMEHVKAERYEIAYNSTTQSFQATRSADAFRAEVQDGGLHRHESVAWYERRGTGEGVILFGRADLDTGDTLYVRIVMAGGEVWRVDALALGDGARPGASEDRRQGDTTAENRAGEGADDGSAERGQNGTGTPEGEEQPSTATYPDDATRDRLVVETLLAFNDAVQRQDFTEFHQRLARPFREQHQPAEIRNAFQAFIDRGVDIAPIRGTAPVYDEGTDPAEVGETGRMTLAGHFPTQPARTDFALSYVWEENDWRLIRIRVRVANEDTQEQTQE